MQKKYVNNLSEATIGTIFSGNVKILRKAKPGPVVFLVSDGTGTIDAVIKDSGYEVNDTVFLEGFVLSLIHISEPTRPY
mgnify:CR=1 FL=1